MGRSDGTLVFDTKIITDGFNKGMSAIKTAAKGIGVITAGFTAATGAALKFAGELEQNLGGSEAVFKEFASTVQKTADTAFKNMGLSTSDFLATANKMGALFQGSGFKIQESAELSAEVMQRAADVASIMGIDVSMAMESIAGAAKGNFTMMDNLGVAMNDTTLAAYALEKGITKSTRAMTNQEKIALAMEMFLERTEYAAGNYAKENETLAGALNTASAALKNFMSGTGEADDLAESLSNAGKVIVENIGELTPMLAKGIGDIFSELAPLVPEMLDELTEGVMSAIEELADGISGNSDKMADAVIKLGETLVSGVIRITPKLADAAKKIISSFADELGNTYPILKPFTAAVKLLADNMELCIISFAAFKGLTTIVSVIRAIMASFQTANLQLALYTAQNGAAAISASGLAAALSVKEIIVGALTGKIHLLTAAQALLNKVWAANPVGVVVGGVVALGAALAALYSFITKETEAEKQQRLALEANKAAVKELTDAYNEYHESNSLEANEGLASLDNIERLSNELDNLVDSNGKVMEADEARVKFILGELNGALGTEAKLVDGVVSRYGDLKNAIQEAMKAKEAEILMEEATKNFTEAVKKQAEAEKAVAEARKNYSENHTEENRKALEEAEATYYKYVNDIIAYEHARTLAAEGNNDALIGYLHEQRNARNDDLHDLDGYNSQHDKKLKIAADNYNSHINKLISLIKNFDGSAEMQAMIDETLAEIKVDETKIAELGGKIENGIIKGFENGTEYGEAAFSNKWLAETATTAIKSGAEFGDTFLKELYNHLNGNTFSAEPFNNFKKVVEEKVPEMFRSQVILQKNEANGKEASDYYVQGITNYANSEEAHNKVYNAGFGLGQTLDTGFHDGEGAHSPSVFAEAAAKFYVEGAVLGLENNADMLYEAAKELGGGMNAAFENSITSNLDGIRTAISSITGVIKEESEQKLKVYEAEHKKIEMLHDFGIDDEETYYKKLEYLRDNYLTENSDKWIEITQDLYDYQEGQLEEHRDKVEEIYDDIADYVTDKLEDVSKKQQKFTEKLNDSTPLYQKVKITAGDETTEFYRLNDFGASNKAAAEYAELLEKVTARIKASDVSDEAKSGIISELESLGSSEDGIGYIKAMLGAKDDEFANYLTGYQNMLATNVKTSADMYYDDAVSAANEGYQYMIDEFTKAGFEIPEGFLVSGALSAENFGRAFMEELDLQMQEIQKKLSDFNASISASVGTGGSISNDNRSTTYHIYGGSSKDTVKEIENYETVKRLSGQ